MFPDYFPAYNTTGILGSEAIWFGAIGPAVHRDASVPARACLGQNQIAASMVTALGLDWRGFDKGAGAPLPFFAKP